VATGKRWSLWLAGALAAAGCGGGEEVPAAGQPAVEPPPPTATAQDTSAQDSASQALALSREVFSYRGSGRDPFRSLITTGDMRPLPQDLRVTGITFDARYPQRSVAVLNDVTDGRRYTVRPGDVIGRIRVVEVRETEVIAVVQEFGVDRQVVLPLRRRQEETP
jgi:hypothetical protein